MSPSVEPFDEIKYKALMDGLECSEILLSQVKQYEAYRIDSHFYEKRYRELKEILSRIICSPLIDLVAKPIQTGHTPSMAVDSYYGGNIALIKTDNLHDNNIKAVFSDYLTTEGNAVISRTELATGDIITTIIGATEQIIARSAIVTEEYLPANINQNIVQIRIDPHKALPEYVNSYLNSKYGKQYLHYLSRQTEQINLNCKEVEIVQIPLFSEEFQKGIVRTFRKAQNRLSKSKVAYKDAEQLLSSFLNMKMAKNEGFALSIKSFSDSLQKAGRLDAEYYQPKYDTLFKVLSNFHCEKLGGEDGLVTIMKSIEPGSDTYQEEGIPFVRVSDLDKFGIVEPTIKLPANIVPNVGSLFPKKDTILLSKDGSVGLAYKVEEPLQVITSGALLHLTIKDTEKILPDYLTLVLNSPIVQLQAERDVNSAVIPHWKPSEIENVLIPVLDMDTQKEIATKAQESFSLRKESKRLLDLAVKAVEIAIETDEETATRWLELQ